MTTSESDTEITEAQAADNVHPLQSGWTFDQYDPDKVQAGFEGRKRLAVAARAKALADKVDAQTRIREANADIAYADRMLAATRRRTRTVKPKP